MRSLTTCTLHQTLFWWSSQGWWDWRTCSTYGRDETFIQVFSRNTWREKTTRKT